MNFIMVCLHEKANFRGNPQCLIVSTADKILEAVLKLLIKSVTSFSRGNAAVILMLIRIMSEQADRKNIF